MVCLKCGKELEPDAKFCPDCGEAQTEAEAVETETTATDTTAETSSTKKKKSNKLILIIIAAVLVIAVAVAAVVVINKQNKKKLNSETQAKLAGLTFERYEDIGNDSWGIDTYIFSEDGKTYDEYCIYYFPADGYIRDLVYENQPVEISKKSGQLMLDDSTALVEEDGEIVGIKYLITDAVREVVEESELNKKISDAAVDILGKTEYKNGKDYNYVISQVFDMDNAYLIPSPVKDSFGVYLVAISGDFYDIYDDVCEGSICFKVDSCSGECTIESVSDEALTNAMDEVTE